ncbi:delta-1-pyrroline-5-carboxylate dehydrogenase [Caldalkalibacillus thermarum TA2.A1]|uniref:L-glutamate gamma-semialdehyde dehydrogenase n=1 Tax=Caldalkalibacillus thermarum (strain TA2.A1) TaxID=986075 RepID=F5LAW7_CALTT|nr:L-glutamate gamma-semialdehyde dehydrogenase [Caldalkalibacillus thermarum]EGL81506.1 delta-1-pyrroline-5-carboxylate dehydrogenase [Caldalkalibacillus thermarum TA2.A1]QZT33807.1 L-glutamate gamma-semialdehyde dehydrogenase [Caldalkalibacillus thermarum TA2.A1]
MLEAFRPEPFTNFQDEQNRAAFQAALKKVEEELGKDYPLIIGGERITTEQKIVSVNPSKKAEVVGRVSKADQALAEKAIQTAARTFEEWKRVPAEARARYLFKVAALLRRRKHEFSAWLVKEAGKSWVEADADTAEAIDFLEYYGRDMIRLAQPQELTRLPGEDNEAFYIPLGVGIVIPPWNFPLAIMCGMTVSSIVTGNTVVLKPASATPVIAYKFMELLEEAGLPAGVVNYLPGSGAEVGDYLVEHPQTRFITFTGSRDVGLRINELAAKRSDKQKWIKRVVAEMGGKNAVIVDKEADLEAAAQGIVVSAFGFSGQKCSAGSRAIVLEEVYDRVLELVVEKTKQLKVGDVSNPDVFTGPVIDEAAQNKILEYIEIGKQEGRLLVGGEKGSDEGFFVQPTIFADVDPNARIAQEEIFGPVVAFIKAKDFDHALEIANNTEYGLTGSVYSRNRFNLEKAREEFYVGNLYFNRKSTGAIVGVHPFGGFNMSGTNAKTGDQDYLLNFLLKKAVSEVL